MTDRRRVIGIIRQSQRNRRKDAGQSPEVQRRSIVDYAKRQDGWSLRARDILDENDIRDGNVSGYARLSERPGLGPAVELVEAGKAHVILAADHSRLFRNLDEQRAVIARVELAGGEFWSVAGGRISHATSRDEMFANIAGAITHGQRQEAREKSIAAVTQAIEQGRVPWHQTAPGYVRNEDGTLAPDPALRKVIVGAFEMRSGGATVAAVRAYLAENGVERSYHGTMHLLRDRIYLGEIVFKGPAEASEGKPKGQGRVNLAAHDAIVDRGLFERVQRVAVPRGRRAQSERLLARLGVLRCSGCGGRMVVGHQSSGYPFYRCGHVREDCAARVTISAETVEAIVVGAVRAALANVEGRASAEDGVREAEAAVESARTNYEAALGVLSDFTDAAAVERLRELRATWDAARERLEQVGGQRAAVTISGSADWDLLSLAGRRALIRAVVESVVVAPGRGADRVTVTLVR